MAHTHLSRIDTLNLAENNLNSDAIAALVTASLPVLADLHLAGNNLDAAAAQWLSKGEWNNLEFLDLGRNCLDNEAMHHLAQGEWPRLHWLALLRNDFDSDGLDSLTQGEWPLSCLYLDIRLGTVATWRMLDLDPQCLPHLRDNIRKDGKVLVSRLEQHKSVWKCLPEESIEIYFV